MNPGHNATCTWRDDDEAPVCGAPCTCWCSDGKHLDCWCEEHAAEFYGDDDEEAA